MSGDTGDVYAYLKKISGKYCIKLGMKLKSHAFVQFIWTNWKMLVKYEKLLWTREYTDEYPDKLAQGNMSILVLQVRKMEFWFLTLKSVL